MAARMLAAQGHLIIGGEVYCRQSVGWAAYLGEWEIALPDAEDPPSAERIEAGLEAALEAIDAGPGAWGAAEDPSANLRFFFAVGSPPPGDPTNGR